MEKVFEGFTAFFSPGSYAAMNRRLKGGLSLCMHRAWRSGDPPAVPSTPMRWIAKLLRMGAKDKLIINLNICWRAERSGPFGNGDPVPPLVSVLAAPSPNNISPPAISKRTSTPGEHEFNAPVAIRRGVMVATKQSRKPDKLELQEAGKESSRFKSR